ncbi:MAG: hypothetical protein B6242_16520 [Anaerolineaceae bacterium 4572_78]|nr:MAG: hypothetical protein B6242_16520 [Anaerolineaceae bacterium 4572_78]
MSLAQEVNDPKLKKADHYYTNFSFDKAIEKYEELGDKDLNSQRNLALSYMNTRDYVKAEELFSEIVKHKDALAEDLYNYASVLEINKNYEEAEQWMNFSKGQRTVFYRSSCF